MKKFFVFIGLFFINLMLISADDKVLVTLSKCIDGDTAKFFIDGKEETVRFLSINAPEIAHGDVVGEAYGDEASIFTCDALTNANGIKLEYDPNSDKTDKYGRVLAWVFVDNKLLQEMIVEKGLAEVKYVYADYMYTSKLEVLESKAKDRKIGMWSDNDDIDLIIYIIGGIIVILISIYGRKLSKK